MRNAMRYRGSMRRARSRSVRDTGGVVAAKSVMTSACRLGDRQDAIDERGLQHLLRAGRPVNHDAIDPFATTEAEVQAPIVLAREAHAAIDHASLPQVAG